MLDLDSNENSYSIKRSLKFTSNHVKVSVLNLQAIKRNWKHLCPWLRNTTKILSTHLIWKKELRSINLWRIGRKVNWQLLNISCGWITLVAEAIMIFLNTMFSLGFLMKKWWNLIMNRLSKLMKVRLKKKRFLKMKNKKCYKDSLQENLRLSNQELFLTQKT